jgi:hypothetical protein
LVIGFILASLAVTVMIVIFQQLTFELKTLHQDRRNPLKNNHLSLFCDFCDPDWKLVRAGQAFALYDGIKKGFPNGLPHGCEVVQDDNNDAEHSHTYSIK